MKSFNEIKEYAKDHKKQILIGVGGATLLIGGFFIGKKVGSIKVEKLDQSAFDALFDFFKDIPEGIDGSTYVTKISNLNPENIVKKAKEIDEIVFTELAGDIDNCLTDIHCDNDKIERVFDCGEGIVKKLVVNMETVKG